MEVKHCIEIFYFTNILIISPFIGYLKFVHYVTLNTSAVIITYTNKLPASSIN